MGELDKDSTMTLCSQKSTIDINITYSQTQYIQLKLFFNILKLNKFKLYIYTHVYDLTAHRLIPPTILF